MKTMTPSNVSAEERVEHTPRQPIDLARENKIYQDIVLSVTNCSHCSADGERWTDVQKAVVKVKAILAEKEAKESTEREALVSALRELLSAEKLDDGDPILENARAKADAILKSVSPKEKAIK